MLVKRWIKDLGNPIMALVILTERRPYEALGITLRRLSFLLLPLSVVFVRYFPELGRAITWTEHRCSPASAIRRTTWDRCAW